MLTPKFWYVKKSIYPLLLTPFSCLWEYGSNIRAKRKNRKIIDIPIICIGNIVAGGAGKTPSVLALLEILLPLKMNLHVIYKGYKIKNKSTLKVDRNVHDHLEVGDEPLFLSKKTTTWVTNNRLEAIKEVSKDNADLIILDDGLQDTSVYKDLSVLVFNKEQAIGNGKIIPSGPMRESLTNAFNKSDCVFIIDDKNKDIGINFPSYLEKIYFETIMLTSSYNIIKNKKIIAFSGIAQPIKFKSILKRYGAKIIYFKEFPDHYVYKRKEIENILNFCNKKNAICVTTEKDYIRIPQDLKNKIFPIYIKLKIKNKINLTNLIQKKTGIIF